MGIDAGDHSPRASWLPGRHAAGHAVQRAAFAPASAPLAHTCALDDGVIRDVLVAITTRPSGDRRERITYADLGVEQLGAVYERVLDFRPERRGTAFVLARSGTRKATGTFYTPRAMTEYLVGARSRRSSPAARRRKCSPCACSIPRWEVARSW